MFESRLLVQYTPRFGTSFPRDAGDVRFVAQGPKHERPRVLAKASAVQCSAADAAQQCARAHKIVCSRDKIAKSSLPTIRLWPVGCPFCPRKEACAA